MGVAQKERGPHSAVVDGLGWIGRSINLVIVTERKLR